MVAPVWKRNPCWQTLVGILQWLQWMRAQPQWVALYTDGPADDTFKCQGMTRVYSDFTLYTTSLSGLVPQLMGWQTPVLDEFSYKVAAVPLVFTASGTFTGSVTILGYVVLNAASPGPGPGTEVIAWHKFDVPIVITNPGDSVPVVHNAALGGCQDESDCECNH